MRDKTLLQHCKDFMSKQDKLELFRDYNDYLDVNQVAEFISYCEDQIKNGNYLEPSSYLYDYFTEQGWFNDYESENFYEAFMKTFEELYGEEEWFNYEDANEILRELMYDMDLYDSCIEHFNKDYNFYLLTDPERTVCIRDYPYSFNYRNKYYQSLKLSQGWTENMNSMRTLLDGAYDYLGVCIHYNTDLFDFINLLKAKRLTIKKGSAVYLFNPYNGSGGCETDLERDWSFNLRLNEIGFGVDGARRGPRGYTPEQVYGWYHPYFDKNMITFKSLKK